MEEINVNPLFDTDQIAKISSTISKTSQEILTQQTGTWKQLLRQSFDYGKTLQEAKQPEEVFTAYMKFLGSVNKAIGENAIESFGLLSQPT